jgi:hypothetical protein
MMFEVNGNTKSAEDAIRDFLWVDGYSGGAIEQAEAKIEKLEKLVVQLAVAYATTAGRLNHLMQYDSSYQFKEKSNGI